MLLRRAKLSRAAVKNRVVEAGGPVIPRRTSSSLTPPLHRWSQRVDVSSQPPGPVGQSPLRRMLLLRRPVPDHRLTTRLTQPTSSHVRTDRAELLGWEAAGLSAAGAPPDHWAATVKLAVLVGGAGLPDTTFKVKRFKEHRVVWYIAARGQSQTCKNPVYGKIPGQILRHWRLPKAGRCSHMHYKQPRWTLKG